MYVPNEEEIEFLQIQLIRYNAFRLRHGKEVIPINTYLESIKDGASICIGTANDFQKMHDLLLKFK